ncbi:MAG TPA: type IX secretion system membrane protein PorP/SprF [Bacteroidia bacterium]|jgi:type IX secretion system PorP/SprF family membrane protein
MFSLIGITVQAQHAFQYSQYYFSGILINPAYAGSQGALNFTTIYRNQWTGMEGAPENISIGLHSPLRNDKVNAGLIFLNNKYGLTCESQFLGVYAYRLKFKKSSLSFGLQAGVKARKNDWSKIETTEENDPLFEGNVQRTLNGTAGFGIFYKSDKLFAGVSSPVLYTTEQNFSFQYCPVVFSAGLLLKINDNLKVRPAGLVKYISNSPVAADISAALYIKEIIGIGAGYRSEDAVYAFTDIKLNDQFSAGYSYDYTLSPLNNYSNGSHEIMLRYLFNYKLNVKNPRYF